MKTNNNNGDNTVVSHVIKHDNGISLIASNGNDKA